jgi:GTP-binding protein
MFVDHAIIEVKAGAGGDGMIAFLREKYMPNGGPAGGNGGKGSSIILRANKNLNTLYNFRFSKIIVGENGGKGETKNKYGRAAKDIYVDVPIGTVALEEDSHNMVANLTYDGQEIVVAKGGRGGRGNAAFKNSKNRVPKIAENGLPGEDKRLILELKLLADIGLIGLPNAGKSTLLSIVSNAKPEIADYPFTTISPNLGMVFTKQYGSFIIADLPGLIEGAHLGKGLGLEFLRHVERCRVLVHLVSMESSDPYKDYKTIRNEIKKYGHRIDERPEIIIASKMDEEDAEKKRLSFEKKLKKPVIGISALTHEGIDKLISKCQELLSTTDKFPLYDEQGHSDKEEKVYDARKDFKPEYEIKKIKEHTFEIYGDRIIRTYHLINVSTDEGVMKLISYLMRIGVDDTLKKLGAEDGDTVILDDFEFEYIG